MRLSMYDQCVWTTKPDCYVEHMWVNIRHMLDWSQNCRNALVSHECSTSDCTKWDADMAGGDKLSENSNPLLSLAFDGTTRWNKDLCTQSRTENGC